MISFLKKGNKICISEGKNGNGYKHGIIEVYSHCCYSKNIVLKVLFRDLTVLYGLIKQTA